MRRTTISLPPRQQGIVLLALFMVLFMFGAGVFLTVMNNNVVDQRRDHDTMDALRAAKDVIIAYSVAQADYYGPTSAGPGHLMCPDADGDGDEDSPCPADAIGRLPQSITLPSGDSFPVSAHNTGIDQQFWYALSDAFRRDPAGIINSLTVATLSVDGGGGVAAVLLAPEELLTGQARPTAAAANYLEAGNVTGPAFVSSDPLNPTAFNDRVLAITSNDLLSPVTARVAEVIKIQLDDYHAFNDEYPGDQLAFDDALNGNACVDDGKKKKDKDKDKGGCDDGEDKGKVKDKDKDKDKDKGGGGGGELDPMPEWFINNEWALVSNYTRIDADNATVQFTGCNIVYSISFGVISMARSTTRC